MPRKRTIKPKEVVDWPFPLTVPPPKPAHQAKVRKPKHTVPNWLPALL